ncbi:sugar ABC transporter permease [Clostridia bacterium]|nr:sugar ABC transporter permease [Clostridia bacterium]
MTRKHLGTAAYHLVALAVVFAVMLPFFWMISTSLKNRGAIMALPVQWIPKAPTLENYVKLFTRDGFMYSMANSVVVSFASVALTLVSAAMAAFAFAKLKFRGSGVLFMVVLATMMIPSQVLFIPLYLLMGELNLADSLAALILPSVFKAFAIFMLRQQMMSIPDAYMEAPAIDGAGLGTTFLRVICPMCKSSFATLAIICFMDAWNDYLLPLVMLRTKSKFTLPIILSTLSGQYKNEYSLLMAGALISMVPILILYAAAQRFFAAGLQVGGIKG